ncbi:hypothetical protein [Agromyces sp. CF514]|uniref:hypothetical protein n=1 Tax=Agromyces sp. CF514 TaxID=1881031 RepID=UPI000B88A4EA|nr:hypothetical protein [Agromyces sp. CF514]
MALLAAMPATPSILTDQAVVVAAPVLRVVAGVAAWAGFVSGVVACGVLRAYPEARIRWLPGSMIAAAAIAFLLPLAQAFWAQGLH